MISWNIDYTVKELVDKYGLGKRASTVQANTSVAAKSALYELYDLPDGDRRIEIEEVRLLK